MLRRIKNVVINLQILIRDLGYIYIYIKIILRLMETISILQYFIVNFHRDIDTGIIRLL